MTAGKLGTDGAWGMNIVLLVAAVCIVALVVYMLRRGKRANGAFPVESLQVTVLDKRQDEQGNGMIGKTSRNVSLGMGVTKNTVTFQDAHGDLHEFVVGDGAYDDIRYGQKGTLKCQNGSFVSFTAS